VFIGDRTSGRRASLGIVLKARELGLAGATVLRGPMASAPQPDAPPGSGTFHRPASSLKCGQREKIRESSLPRRGVLEGLITIERVRVLNIGINETAG